MIKNEIEHLLKIIEDTKVKSIPAYQTAKNMINFYELLSKKKTKYFETLSKDTYDEVLAKIRILNHHKIQNIITTREEHKRLFSSLNIILEDANLFGLDEEKSVDDVPNENEMYEIILDFFKYHNKNAVYIFNNLIKEKRIFKIPNKSELDKAYNISNLFQSNFYIFIKEGNNSVTTMASIVHEIGHSMDEIQLLYSRGRREFNYYTAKSFLIEAISTMYEKEFLNFLLEEGIYREYVEQEIKNHYYTFQFFSEQTELLLYLPSNLLKMDYYKIISKQDFIHYLEDDGSLIVDYDAIDNPSEMDLSSNLDFCYGFVLSTYFSYLKHSDVSKYKESFHNFLKLRADYFSPNTLELIGTTPQDLSVIIYDDYERFSSKRLIK